MANGTEATAVSPPAGTGNAPGLGEAFTLDLNTGQGGYTVALPMPEGVAGLKPDLRLRYAHGSGVSPFGQGWTMPLRRIDRSLDLGVPGESGVERYHDGGVELVEVAPGEHRALVESAYARYRRHNGGWIVDERTGLSSELGTTAAGRVTAPGHPERVVSWLLERTIDTSGNEIRYTWDIVDGTPYLKSVTWAHHTARLTYENRPDVHRNGRAGFLRTLTRRATAIELYVEEAAGPRRTRTWVLGYEQAAGSGVSLLSSVGLVSHGSDATGPDVVRRPQRFGYAQLELSTAHARFIRPEGAPPPSLSDPQTTLVQLDDLPVPGVLSAASGRHVYWPASGDGTWSPPRPVNTPHASALSGETVLLDLDGNASVDMLVASGPRTLQGYYENGGPDGFRRFVAYPRDARALPSFTDPRVRLADLDGDGRIDAVRGGTRGYAAFRNAGAAGWHEPTAVPRGDGVDGPDVDLADPLVRLADMTGDGLPDLVRLRSGRIEYWPNLGHGRFGAVVVMTGSPRLRADASALLLVDIDGDGCGDLVQVDGDGVRVWLNRSGQGWSPPHFDPLVPPPVPGTLRAADTASDGRAALVWNSPRAGLEAYVAYEFGSQTPPYVLTSVDNGAGLVSRISYRSSVDDARRDRAAGQPWPTHLPFPVTVVAATSEHDTVTGRVAESRYAYSDGHFDPVTRQFQGFGRVEKREIGDASRPDTLTVLRFLIGEDRKPGNTRRHAALNRLQHRNEVYQLDGTAAEPLPLLIEESEHQLDVLDVLPDGRERIRIAVRRSRRRWRERTLDERIEEHTYAYDDAGNVVEDVWRASGTRDGVEQPPQLVRSTVEYVSNEARNLIDRPCRLVKRDASGTLLADLRKHYDGPAFTGLPLGDADRGLLTRELEWAGTRADIEAHYTGMDLADLGYVIATDADGRESVFAPRARSEYDAAGREIAARTPLGVETRFGYDTSGVFRVREDGALGLTERQVDPGTGQILLTRAPDGVETAMRYDAQGRLAALILPGDTEDLPTRSYAYHDHVVPHAVRVSYRLTPGAADTLETAVYFDGLSKEIQRRVRARPDTVLVSGTVQPNAWGDPLAEHEPSFATGLDYAAGPTTGAARRFFYDAQGRAVRTVDYGGGVSTVVYRPFEAESRDGLGRTRLDRMDPAHRRVAVVEDPAGTAMTTTYTVGVLGELLAVADQHGVATSHTYDACGNRLTVDSREAGERTLFYDAGKRVVRTIDARGVDISADFDDSERMTEVRADGAVLESYTYDDLATGGLGRLREVSYPGGGQRFAYDARGDVTTQEWFVDGHPAPHRLEFAHNGLGRITAVTYPDGSELRYTYSPNGVVVAIEGIIDDIEYNARMLPVRVRYANGVETTMTYTAGPGRVAHQRAVAPDGTVLEDARYSYDVLTQLIRADDGTTVTDYSYDPLAQLVATSETTHGGTTPQRTDYTYSGRDLSAFGERDALLAYGDTAHPRRPTSVTEAGGTPEALTYDANGNLTVLPGRTLSYDAKNQLSRAERPSVISDYAYDHTGMRVHKRVVDRSSGNAVVTDTVFLGRWAEIRGGVLARFAVLGMVRVALLRGPATTWIHTDQLGSATYFTSDTGTELARLRYTPFGNRKTAAGTAPHVVFALHEWDDEAGLFFMRRRYYAPDLGRFVTPDGLYLLRPEQGVDDPRTLSLYTYVGNDPLNNVDPTGTSFWSVVGAIVGVIVGVVAAVLIVAAFACGIGFGLLAIAGLIGLVTAGYALASANAGNGFGEFMRGFLIGLNAGLNATLLTAMGLGVVGVAIGVLIFLGSFDSIASSDVYQGFLGWGNWLMPMSWLVVGLGLVFFVLNVLGWAFTLGQVDALNIQKIRVDWKTGTIFLKGGWISNLNKYKTAFNMGNFAFIHKDSTDDHLEHEAGHSLNLAAFGSAFHLIGFVDEVLLGNRSRAFSERLADGNEPPASRPSTALPMWS
ncbi:toxin TcdB middle/N-terminal domain-containing protein [Streptomyces sp. NBC_00878]|uniref:toxin TcdB middle/N-terminal domain-containing protein n=1 Tax=Streptomyces sp. NBC_00878 TaxID=2975854 RepID=UPI00225BAD7E|nr:toxin TcdB middle/N-terminal domain-containing protein [Streptomyces sp. NBC_00878]MCX4903450.1 FG-GAP-like repeat-containing protein [Streptomyces sp. NBC_00878]